MEMSKKNVVALLGLHSYFLTEGYCAEQQEAPKDSVQPIAYRGLHLAECLLKGLLQRFEAHIMGQSGAFKNNDQDILHSTFDKYLDLRKQYEKAHKKTQLKLIPKLHLVK